MVVLSSLNCVITLFDHSSSSYTAVDIIIDLLLLVCVVVVSVGVVAVVPVVDE